MTISKPEEIIAVPENKQEVSTQHLQYLEDNKSEIYKFEDSLVEEVTTNYPHNAPDEGTTVFQHETVTEITEDHLAVTQPTKLESAPSVEHFTSLDDVTVTTESIGGDDINDDDTYTEFTTISPRENIYSSSIIPIEEISTETSVVRELGHLATQSSIDETTDGSSIITKTDVDYNTDAADQLSTVTSRPFRYSLYNRRPGSKLQEIMEKRTASPATSTSTNEGADVTLSPAVSHATTLLDQTQDITTESVRKIGSETTLDTNSTAGVVIPIFADTRVSVTTSPLEYKLVIDEIPEEEFSGDDSIQYNKESLNLDDQREEENESLNIADKFEKMNLIERALMQEENGKINRTTQNTGSQNDAIIGVVKNVVSAAAATNATLPIENIYDYNYDYYYSENNDQSINKVTATPTTQIIDNGSLSIKNLSAIEYKYDGYNGGNGTSDLEYEYEYYDYYDSTANSSQIESSTDSSIAESTTLQHSEDLIKKDFHELTDMPAGVAILTDGFFYPGSQKPTDHSDTTLATTVKNENKNEMKIAAGFSVKDSFKESELSFGPDDVEGNQVRTDRQNILDGHLEEMTIEGDDPNAPPVTLLVSSNADRIDVGNRDTFDISVSSSLFTDHGEKQIMSTKGQVLPASIIDSDDVATESVTQTKVKVAMETEKDNHAQNNGNIGVGVGQVIPVDVSETRESGSQSQEEDTTSPTPPSLPPPSPAPSFLGALIDIFTRPERPRPRPVRPERIPSDQDDVPANRENLETPILHPRPQPFRPFRPDHAYRPFRHEFRPPPKFRPDSTGFVAGDTNIGRPLRPPSVRPTVDDDNLPLSQQHPEVETLQEDYSPVIGMLPPGPLSPTESESRPVVEEITTDSSVPEVPETMQEENVNTPINSQVPDTTIESTSTVTEDSISHSQGSSQQSQSNPEPSSNTQIKLQPTMPPVIDIDGPLADFINRLGNSEGKIVPEYPSENDTPSTALNIEETFYGVTDVPVSEQNTAVIQDSDNNLGGAILEIDPTFSKTDVTTVENISIQPSEILNEDKDIESDTVASDITMRTEFNIDDASVARFDLENDISDAAVNEKVSPTSEPEVDTSHLLIYSDDTEESDYTDYVYYTDDADYNENLQYDSEVDQFAQAVTGVIDHSITGERNEQMETEDVASKSKLNVESEVVLTTNEVLPESLITTEKAQSPVFHNIPDGSFVISHSSAEYEIGDSIAPESRPTIVLPGSRPVLPFLTPQTPFDGSVVKRPQQSAASEVDLISPPLIETGFQALRPDEEPVSDVRVTDNTVLQNGNPDLPPSLPNLQ